MKSLILFSLGLCLVGTAQASTVYTLTQTPAFALNSGTAHTEQSWDFTVLPNWNFVTAIDSMTVTETFTGVTGDDQFASTIINFSQPLGTASAIFTIFGLQTLATPETVTDTIGVGGFTQADLTGGSLGQFHTRVARNAGTFTLASIKIDITAETPEPATFALLGLGLAGIGFAARRRRA